ncbi:MAG: hypothetical protein ACYDEX_03065 [Mobilitalea sp.]
MKVLRKTATSIMILVFCVIVLAGCKKNQVDSPIAQPTTSPMAPSITPSMDNKPTEVPTDTSADNSDEEDSEVIKEGTIPKIGNVILKELAFNYNGNTIGISDFVDDEKLESILGEAEEIKSHTYSYDDGLNMDPLIGFTEKQYKFPGLKIKTIDATEDKQFFIFHIIITDSNYSTIRNIKVGDSVKKLKEAYPEGNLVGNGAANEEDDFQYLPVNYVDGMKFHIKNEKIESILMYKLLD